MNITNLEITQATIELSLAFAFIVTAVLLVINTFKKKGMKLFIAMFFIISAVLIAESLAYISRGNTDALNIVINRTSNFLVFFLNFLLMSIFIRYMYSIFEKYEVHPSKIYVKIVDASFLIATLILIINLFTGWMYTFDAQNYYSRNYMWYFFTCLSLALPVVATIMCVKYKNQISKINYYTILLYVWFPIIFLIAQAFIYGYAILTIGMAIDLFFMFAFYLMELRNKRIDDDEIANIKIKKTQSIIMFSFLTAFISAAIISCLIAINRMVKENNKSNEIIISNIICDDINYEFHKLITVSETMSQSYAMKEFLLSSGTESPEIVEENMKNYLSSIKDGFGYQMVYAVADNSKIYYNYKGVSRIIDEKNYGEDIWYKNFYESDKNLEMNIDTDKDTDYVLSVFVNSKIKDDRGNVIGICGVGIEIEKIQNIISNYEQKYNATIALTDKTGLIQIASNIESIEKDYLDSSYFGNVSSNSFHFMELNDSYNLTKYLEALDYYLVINYKNINKLAVVEIITPSVIIFAIGILLLGTFFIMTYIEDKRAYDTIIEKKKAAITDEMTGLLNRSAYEQDISALKNVDLSNYSVIQFDINCLKLVNDTLGHKAGDELIVGTAHSILNVFQGFGKCYRIGGDEFVAILKLSKEILEENMITFNHLLSNYKGTYIDGISVSVGIVHCSEYLDMSIDDIMVLADDLMYNDKAEYYKKSGLKRRII